jgi:hypothetical protein
VKAKKATVRVMPALLMLAAVTFFGNLGTGDLERKAEGWGGDPLDGILFTPPTSPLPQLPCAAVGELIGISEQAAALTGSLALIEKDDRLQAAAQIVTEIRVLQQRAGTQPGGIDLVWTLGDLVEALKKYARGDRSAIGDLRDASARNASIRETLKNQQSLCGGTHNE